MGAGDLTKIRWATGKLSVDPTDPDLTGTWPFGGTGLGTGQKIAWTPGLVYEPVRAAEWGGEPVEFVRGGQSPRLICDLREWFGDALTTVWPDATGSDLPFPGASGRAGDRASDRVVTLLFTPDDPASDPALIFYAAAPMPAEGAQLPLSIYRELAHPVVFAALRDENGNTYDCNLLTSLAYPSA